MTAEQAKKIRDDYFKSPSSLPDDIFVFTEAMKYLITTFKNPDDMLDLGSVYYTNKEFDLALKYYEMAAESGSATAAENLGYIWYYGRTGKKDYEKAFNYFSKGKESGSLISAYKLADMYKNGYYVPKDYEQYCRIIEDLYLRVADSKNLYDPLPEIFTRLAKIRSNRGGGDKAEAVQLYHHAKSFLAQRLIYSQFFGDLNIMMWLVEDLYRITPFDEEDLDLYDLFYLAKKPVTVRFYYSGADETLSLTWQCVREEGGTAIKFGDKWYKTAHDFFSNATVDGKPICSALFDLWGFKVI